MTVEQIGQDIAQEAADLAREVIMRWTAIARDEPWLEHLTHIRQDNLPAMIRALARASLVDPESDDYARALIREARAHGASRREEGYEDTVIPAEYVLLRRSLHHILIRERRTPPHVLLSVLSRLELGMATAETSALLGYHTTETRADDPAAERMLTEWSGLVHEVVEAGRRTGGSGE